MAKNEGTIDRIARIVIGVVLVVVGLMVASKVAMVILLILGAIALVTGVIGWCGLYALLGISTTKAAPAAGESAATGKTE